jgi:transposase-like protein
MGPKSLQQAILYFADPKNCREYLVARRWPDGVTCPRCGSQNVLFLEKYNRWHCREKHLAPQFTLKTGTIFEDSPLGLDKWLTAVWMLVNSKNGISSWEISRALKVTQKSAWFMDHRIRLALQSGTIYKLGGLGSEVESDETFIGGKAKNMHANRRAQFRVARESSITGDVNLVNKTAVWGVLDRQQRKVRATILPKVNREALQTAVFNQVEHGQPTNRSMSLPKKKQLLAVLSIFWRHLHE